MSSESNMLHQELTLYLHKFEYKWTLRNFSPCLNFSTGQAIESQIFSTRTSTFDNIKWQMKLYPNGHNEEDKDRMIIGLYCRSILTNNFEIPLDCKLIVSNKLKVFKEHEFRGVFKKEKSNWVVSLSALEKFDIILNYCLSKKNSNILTIVCNMSFNSDHHKKYTQLSLSKDLGSLLETKKNYDVILISNDGIEHRAHKAILSCRSTVFSAMFEHEMKEKLKNIVKIEDINSHTLKQILQFIYTGKIEKVENKYEELFIAADKYALDDVKDFCIDCFNESISNSNILNLFQFAQSYNIVSTKLKTAQYFLKNKKQIMSSEGLTSLKNLSRDTLELLVYMTATDETSMLSTNN